MNANLYEGRADAQELVDAVRRRGRRRPGRSRRSPRAPRADGRGRARQLLPDRVGRAGLHGGGDDGPGQPAAHRARPAAHHLPGLAGDVRRTDGARRAPGRTCRPDRLAPTTRAILTQAEADDADLIVGDINATPDHDVMRGSPTPGSATRASGQRGLAADLAGQPRRRSSRCCRRWCEIDHVLLGDSMATLGTHTVDIPGTDHLALVATVAGGERDGRPRRTRRTPSSTAGTAHWRTAGPARRGSTHGRFRPAVVARRRLVHRGVHRGAREHEDVDLSILACDVPALRAHVGDAGTCGATTGAPSAR